MTTRCLLFLLFCFRYLLPWVGATEEPYALHHAAAQGNAAELEQLIQTGHDINHAGLAGYTPLMDAAYAGKAECVRLLLAAGADVNRTDNFGCTALSYAAGQGHAACVKLLLSAPGIDVNKADMDDETPLVKAVQSLQDKCVAILLDAPDVQIRTKDWDAITGWPKSLPIYRILANRIPFEQIPMDAIKRLFMFHDPMAESGIIAFLSSPTLNVHRRDESGKTLLHYAAIWGQAPALKLLLAAGADVNAMDDNTKTPLDYCGFHMNPECHALLTQANGKRNDNNAPPLILRIHAHESARVHELLKAGADVNAVDSDACPALVWAIIHAVTAPKEHQTAAAECLRLLLAHPDIDVNSADGEGCTPLHHAVERGDSACIRLLLQTGKVNTNQSNKRGATALHRALAADKTECAELLAKAPGTDINLPNQLGETALHLAAEHGNAKMVRILLSLPGINANARINISQNTPLMQAVQYPECVKLLANDTRTDISLKNFMGESALHMACQWGNEESLQYLLAHAPVSADELNELLIFSVQRNRVSCAELLLQQNGIQPETISRCVNIATTRGYSELLSLLLQNST